MCAPETPCTAPAAGVLISFVKGGVVRHVRTNARGHYSIRLTPGTYAVHIAAQFGYIPMSAKVSRRKMSTLNILIRTGIQ